MAITFSIPTTEIVITTGQNTVTCQDLLNATRLFESSFQMMSNSKIMDAGGKNNLGAGVFTEIILTILEGNEGPWTLRFVDEATEFTSVTGGTFLATSSTGGSRPVTTNPSLTINQSVSGTLVETGVSGLTPGESANLAQLTADMADITDYELGRWKITAPGTLTLYRQDGVTVLRTFDLLDDVGTPVTVNPFERVPSTST